MKVGNYLNAISSPLFGVSKRHLCLFSDGWLNNWWWICVFYCWIACVYWVAWETRQMIIGWLLLIRITKTLDIIIIFIDFNFWRFGVVFLGSAVFINMSMLEPNGNGRRRFPYMQALLWLLGPHFRRASAAFGKKRTFLVIFHSNFTTRMRIWMISDLFWPHKNIWADLEWR